jgi:hypothetical protein
MRRAIDVLIEVSGMGESRGGWGKGSGGGRGNWLDRSDVDMRESGS